MNNPPFYIGQKVVALNTDRISGFRKKGSVYSVYRIRMCQKCKKWTVDIGEVGILAYVECSQCGQKRGFEEMSDWHSADAFAPLQSTKETIRYVAVSETLRDKAVEIATIETN